MKLNGVEITDEDDFVGSTVRDEIPVRRESSSDYDFGDYSGSTYDMDNPYESEPTPDPSFISYRPAQENEQQEVVKQKIGKAVLIWLVCSFAIVPLVIIIGFIYGTHEFIKGTNWDKNSTTSNESEPTEWYNGPFELNTTGEDIGLRKMGEEKPVFEEPAQEQIEEEPLPEDAYSDYVNVDDAYMGEFILKIGPYYENKNPNYNERSANHLCTFYESEGDVVAVINSTYDDGDNLYKTESREVFMSKDIYNMIEATYYEKEVSDADWGYILGFLSRGDVEYINVALAGGYWGAYDPDTLMWVAKDKERGSLILTADIDNGTWYKVSQVYYDIDKDEVIVNDRYKGDTDGEELFDFLSLMFDTQPYIEKSTNRGQYEERMYAIMDALMSGSLEKATECCLAIQQGQR